jgi:hypothetical protein
LVRSLDGLMSPERLLGSMRGTLQAQLEKQLKSASHLTLQQRNRAASVPGATKASTMGDWRECWRLS